MVKEVKLTKKEEKAVQKKLRHILYERAKKHSSDFGTEFKKHSLVAVTAALGFLIALAWKEPVVELVEIIVANVGVGSSIYSGFISAFVVTVIAVFGLMIISKWSTKED
jgi:hypothetical protein